MKHWKCFTTGPWVSVWFLISLPSTVSFWSISFIGEWLHLGYSYFHTHLHWLTRYILDGKLWWWERGKMQREWYRQLFLLPFLLCLWGFRFQISDLSVGVFGGYLTGIWGQSCSICWFLCNWLARWSSADNLAKARSAPEHSFCHEHKPLTVLAHRLQHLPSFAEPQIAPKRGGGRRPASRAAVQMGH